jgi:serine/threonine-protein kinase
VRARVRLVDLKRQTTIWADRLDASADDPFGLEDALVDLVKSAVQARVAERAAPVDPKIRERYDRARAAYKRFGPANMREAIAILEELDREVPNEPSVMSLLGLVVGKLWIMTGAVEQSLIARAEELVLRAIEADPSSAESFHAIGVLRSQTGDYRQALRAEEEALRRSPLLGEAHYSIGRLLAVTGHTDEGLRRLELAARLDPDAPMPVVERAHALALLGERPRAEELIRALKAKHGPSAGTMLEGRWAVWWKDRAIARRLVDHMEKHPTGASWDRALPMFRALAEGRTLERERETLDALTSARVAPRQRALMHQIAAETYAIWEMNEDALEHIERGAALPQFIELLWLDRCPALDPLRSDPRWASARAMVAARAAQIWE